ncbi:MAG TPA: biotin carboxylase N-terminal domain-containing protein [Candidatus Limnocylindria bacterium]|nr:biotin carboxylase N-terminal domain-containing protein [Candidatus Limnocylindria bacterium]
MIRTVFKTVLIANRGEIACRIAATLHELRIRSVAVHSEADRGALHTRVADQAIAIGAAEPSASYLNVAALIAAARASGAEAIHPGYGFLAENAEFADAVEGAGLVFIGPTSEQIRLMGDKRAARALAGRAKVPVVPGGEGDDPEALVRAARTIGYPVMVKAAFGGGGKGMRAASDDAALREAIESAQHIAQSAFGDAKVFLERRLERARHVEVQVLGDGQGDAIHLFERECSLQRRHQKVIEESPSPALDEPLRARLTAAAVALARKARYRGAGTVEFLLEPDGHFYFLEMNTRLQVEHPVTELVTGLDLVRLQLQVASEGKLPFKQAQVERRGHAIEARVYAEDAARDFLPQAGHASRVRWPRSPFVRVDAGIESGDTVPVHYDPILAKVIVHAGDRGEALARLAGALDEACVHGVVTNLPFLRALARSPEVAQGAFDTEWIEREFLRSFAALSGAPAPELALAAAALAESLGVGGARNGVSRTRRAPDGAGPFAKGRWRLPGLE